MNIARSVEMAPAAKPAPRSAAVVLRPGAGSEAFDYAGAFARNLGLLTAPEQARLRALRVGLPGLGGVGGLHLLNLARLGVESFHLADPDRFEIANLNRQFGARLETFGEWKTEVAARSLQEINPRIHSRLFSEGLSVRNLAEFLGGVDAVVDGIEAFRVEVREVLYAECRRRGIPVFSAGPLGFGAAVVTFTPGGQSFAEYFGLESGLSHAEKVLAYLLGMSPWRPGDVDPAYVDFEAEKGPALVSACSLCAGLAATELLKWLTGRGVLAEPGRGVFVDALRLRTVRIRRKPGLRSPAGRLLRWWAFRRFPSLRRLHERERAARLEGPSA